MLLKFRVANVRSFREERELAFAVPTGKTAHASRQVPVAGGRSMDVYPLIGIFGPNASGKSNLLKGLVEMRTAVLDSYYQWATQRGVPRELFALDPAAERETSLYELDFVNDGIRYTYGFELGPDRVVAEWLHAYPRGRRQVWFDRDASRRQPFEFPGDRLKDRVAMVKMTRPNALFLTVAATNNHPDLAPVFYWFERNLWFLTPEDERYQREEFTRQAVLGPQRDRIEALLRAADLGIEGVEPVETRVAGRTVTDVQLIHTGADGTAYPMPWESESFGTRSWFAMLGPMLLALDEGAVLLVDELDSSLHPRFAAEVVRLFQDPQVNTNDAQLLFTAHDVSVLSTPSGKRLLEPGQVWLVEKDKIGCSDIFPLTAAQPGRHEDLPTSYLAGRFGAVPDLGEGQVGRKLRAVKTPKAG